MNVKDARFIKGIKGTDNILLEKKPHIAFFGRSNVGKSSSINALLGKKNLVKTSSKPGKTLEINFFEVNEKYFFVDLPGYGYAKISEKQRQKIRKMIFWYLFESGVKERVNVLIIDMKVGITEFDMQILEAFNEAGGKVVVLANKFDKLSQKDTRKAILKIEDSIKDFGFTIIPFSAFKKRGIDLFFKEIFG